MTTHRTDPAPRALPALVAGLACALSLAACHETDPSSRCAGVTCSYRGECVLERGVEPACDCDEGFREEGLDCVPDLESGWVFVEAGEVLITFVMGTPEGELGRDVDEAAHEVTLTTGIMATATEVTQAEFEEAMGYNPSFYDQCGARCPVEQVSWHEAAAYANARSTAQQLVSCYRCEGAPPAVECALNPAFDAVTECDGYRLPTEAEWEYMARGGTSSATYNGDLTGDTLGCEQPHAALDPIAAFCGTSPYAPERVGGLTPNPYGLFDVLGNVREWCHDRYGEYPSSGGVDPTGPSAGEERVHRGGAFSEEARHARAGQRGHSPSGETLGSIGFRIVRNFSR